MISAKNKTSLVWAIVLTFFLVIAKFLFSQTPEHFDILITRGRVMDGTGNPWFYADIGIRDGKIAAVCLPGRKAEAERIIDANGKWIVPGFIDIHTHAYDPIEDGQEWGGDEERRYSAPNFVSQGVTTLVTGQCGSGPASIAKQSRALMAHGTGPNTLLLTGHNVIRRLVMGKDYKRAANPQEIEKMCQLVHQAMEEGAYGFSAGLEYEPGRWSDKDELISLVKEIIPYGGVYFAHERSSGREPMWYLPSQDPAGQPSLLDSIIETIEIAERTGARAVATHLKARGANFWGSSHAVIQLIERARKRGVDIWADCYPYNTTGSDGDTVLIPQWAVNINLKEGLQKILADPGKAMALRLDISHEIVRRGGAENIIIMEYPDQRYIGRNLAEIAKENTLTPVEMAIELQLQGLDRPGGVRLRSFSLAEIDVEAYSSQPWTATSSDADITLPEDRLIHPRFYGTFPRKIKRYALERQIISFEDAIRSSTSLPATILRLSRRGLIIEGFQADIVIMDHEKICDKATFFKPHQFAEGIDYVLVGGVLVVDNGKLTWKRPGSLITPRS